MAKRIASKTGAPRRAAPSGKALSTSRAGAWDLWSILQATAIVVVGFWIFWPVMHGNWIGDDRIYLTNNPLLRDPARLWKAWFQPGSFIEYYPIQETLQWLQWKLWGNDTYGYHFTNVSLHITSALLLWRLFRKLGLTFAWLGGLLFLVHPMTVDSVALVNEFKTSLSLPPFLLALIAWVEYEEQGNLRFYFLALGLFLAAMLCKITMMTFPLVIPLYAWWKRGRVGGRDLLASVPFWCISLALGYASTYAGKAYEPVGTILRPDLLAGHPLSRLVLIGQVILVYFSRFFLPAVPMPLYPRWNMDAASPLAWLPWILLLAVPLYLVVRRKTWGRHALLGLGFFAIMIAPFTGVHWISYMNATWILEHLLYLPMIGLIGLVVAGFGQIFAQLAPALRKVAAAALGLLLVLLAVQSEIYAAQFVDEETIARYVIAHNPSASQAYLNLALALINQGRTDEALEAYQACLKLDPYNPDVQNAYGNALQMTGRLPEAVAHIRRALQLQPANAAFYCNLGNALQMSGDFPAADREFQQSEKLNPTAGATYVDYGLCLAKQGRDADAIVQYQKALAIDPTLPEVHTAFGSSLLGVGRNAEAAAQFEQALQSNPNDAFAREMLQSIQGSHGP